jgi:hypothetical protein
MLVPVMWAAPLLQVMCFITFIVLYLASRCTSPGPPFVKATQFVNAVWSYPKDYAQHVPETYLQDKNKQALKCAQTHMHMHVRARAHTHGRGWTRRWKYQIIAVSLKR